MSCLMDYVCPFYKITCLDTFLVSIKPMLNNSGIALLGVQDASGVRSSNPNEYEYEY